MKCFLKFIHSRIWIIILITHSRLFLAGIHKFCVGYFFLKSYFFKFFSIDKIIQAGENTLTVTVANEVQVLEFESEYHTKRSSINQVDHE